LKKHKLSLIIVILTSVFSFSFEFTNPLFFKIIIDNIFINKELYYLNLVIAGIILFFFVSAISTYFNIYFLNKLEYSLYKDISEELYDKVLNSPINHETNNVGDLMARITGNVQIMSGIISQIFEMFMSLLMIFFPLIIMCYINSYLTLIIVSPCILFLILNYFLGKKVEFYQSKVLAINGSLYSFLKDSLSVFLMLKVFNLNNWSQKKFVDKNSGYYDIGVKTGKFIALDNSLNFLFVSIFTILFIIIGGYMVIEDSITLGTFVTFLTYINMFFSPISRLSTLWMHYKSSLPAIDRINEIKEIKVENSGDQKLNITNGEISFNKVDFAYENNKILNNFNAKFNEGLNYIVGENGAGKSTIILLICGLYKVNKGIITIDDQNINQIESTNLLSHVSTVFSYPYLFKGSIYENILVGNLKANKEDVKEVCRLVELDGFINSKEEGYDYDVGEAGQFLSSGEGQKVALARALIRNSPILLLDEATKSIDEETRNIINNILNKLKNKTIIVITHNLEEIIPNSNVIKI
jgi:ABC-type bacteriocin/lantibiotic exporter with double-glycine peptidase domain